MDTLKNLKDNNNNNEGGSCPLTYMQAASIIHNLTTIGENQEKIEKTLSIVQNNVNTICLARAEQSGFKQASGFWFKAGAIAAAVSIVGGLIILLALITGNVDMAAFTSAVIK